MVFPASSRIARVRPYLRDCHKVLNWFMLRDSHPLWLSVPGSFTYQINILSEKAVSERQFLQHHLHNGCNLTCRWFGLFPVRSPLLRESLLISFPWVLRCFSSPGCLPLRDHQTLLWRGCPIRKSPGQSLLSGSPKLIAACYVLHRNLVSRHPFYALE